jgi:uncharacterized protein YodC (DUF2158 family)
MGAYRHLSSSLFRCLLLLGFGLTMSLSAYAHTSLPNMYPLDAARNGLLAGETITTDSIFGGPFCAGQQVNVAFSVTGTFLAGNVFTAELSDASGSFANPVTIGSVVDTLGGTIVATLPLSQGNGSAYRIRVTGSNPGTIGFSNPNDITIYEMPNTPTISASGPVQFCPGGSVTLTSSNSLYNVWSPGGATTVAINVSTAGTYTVVGDNNGCVTPPSNAITVTISPVPPVPTITPGGPTTFCEGGNVVLTTNAPSGRVWQPGGQTSMSITVSQSGSYTVVRSNIFGCTSTSLPTVVTVVPLPETPTITPNGPIAICSGDSVTLTSSSTTGNTWSTGATTQSITVSNAGSYWVRWFDGTCNSDTSNIVVVSVNSRPAVPTITENGSTEFCEGDSVVLMSSSPTGNVWSTGGTTQNIAATSTGDYWVFVDDGTCSSDTSLLAIVTVDPLPPTPTITPSGPTAICTGDSVTLTSSSTTGNIWSTGETTESITVYSADTIWLLVDDGTCLSDTSAIVIVSITPIPPAPTITASGPVQFCPGGSVTLTSNSPTGNLWSTGATTQSIIVSTAGTYSVQVVDGLCVSDPSNTITVTLSPVPPVPTITPGGPTTFCEGGSVILTTNAPSGRVWQPGGQTSVSITVTASGSYTVVRSNIFGCTSTSLPTVVTVIPLPTTPTITPSGPTALCPGDSVTLTSSSATGNTWSTGATTQSITVSTAGSYWVRWFDGTCTSDTSALVNVITNSQPPTPTITPSGPTAFCSGDSVILTSSSPSGNVWSTGATTTSITVFGAGDFWVLVNDGNCISDTSDTVSVSISPNPPTPTITASGPVQFCPGGSVTLTSNSPTGNLWSTGATTQSIIVSTAGTYSVQVVDGLCVSDPSNTITVTLSPVPPVPTITPGGPTTFCEGGSVILTTNAPSGRVWQPGGQTSVSITVTTSGSYTVVRSNIFGCTSTSLPTVVTVIPLPTTPTITPSGPTALCPGDSVTLTSSSATGNTWSTGATTQSITVSTAGSYWVRWFDGTCTSDTSALVNVITNSQPPTPTITPSGPTAFCSGDSVILTSSSPSGNVWSTGATTPSITVFGAGDFWVLVNDGNCISDTSDTVSVSISPNPPTPTITASGPVQFCPGGSVTLTSNCPTGNLWSTGATTQSIIVSTAGTYSVQVVDGLCVSDPSNTITVTLSPVPPVPTITPGGPTTFCEGGSVILTTNAPSGRVWQPGGQTSVSITVTTSGSYTVVRSNIFGCTSTSLPTVVTVIPLPTTPTITPSGPTALCPGDSVTLTSSSATGNTWSTGATTQSITVSTAGSYWVRWFDGTCTSDTSALVNVITNSQPPTPTITPSGPTAFCSGDSVILTSSSPSGNVWSTGATTPSITVFGAGDFWVLVNDGNCISDTSDTVSVSISPNPPTPTITASGPVQFCPGGSVTLTSNSPTGNLWSTGATTQSIIVSTAGTYSVQVVDGLCVSDPSNTITVTLSPVPPVPTITPGGPTTFCQGGSVILTTNAPSGRVWQPGGQTSVSITVTTSGSYTVVRSNIFGCTSTSLPTVVTVIPLPTTPTITPSGPTALCPGDSVTLTSSSATGNTWSTGATTQSITVSTAGSYWVRWFDGTCTSDTSALVNVVTNPSPPTPTITVGGPMTFCSGDSLTLTSSSPSGNVWSTGATTQSITVFAAGSYWVLVNDGNCLSDTSGIVAVTVIQTPPTPVITPNGPTTFCPGDSVILESSSPSNNLWSTGATTPSITVSVGGSYTVQVLNGICISQASNPINVVVAPLPAIPTISVGGPTTFCEGDSVILTTTAPPDLLWLPSSETTSAITVFVSGSYTVSSTNAFGCTSTSLPIAVTVNPTPVTPTISASGSTTLCVGDSVTLTSSSPTNNIWSTGATTPSITVLAAGNYWVQYSELDCISDTSLVTTVVVNPLPPVPTITVTGSLIFCDGDSVVLTANVNTDILWSTGETTQSIVVDSSGLFTVSQTNVYGCISTSDTVETQNLTPPPPIVSPAGPIQFCSGNSIQLSSSSPANNFWSNGATTPAITVTTGGTYWLYVDNGTCRSVNSNSVVVSVSPSPPIPIISANGPVNFCLGDSVTLTSNALSGNLWNTGATTRSIKVFNSGTFTVSRTNIFGCTSTSLPKVVTVRPRPVTPTVTVSGPTTFCAGDSVILTSDSPINNQWSNGGTAQSIKVVASGSYTVVINDGVCPSFASIPVVVTVNPLPATPTITPSGPTTFCAGDSVTLTSSSASGNHWSTGATTQSITVYNTGSFTVWMTNGTCNSLVSAPVNVTVNPIPPSPTISANGPTTFCSGDSVTLTSSNPNGNTWTPGSFTTVSIVVHSSGTYAVTTTLLGCTSAPSAPITVSIGDSISPTITCPTNVNLNNDQGLCGAVVTYSVSFNDNCSGATLNQTVGLASGSNFPVGLTTNSFVVTDFLGNTASCSFNVTVVDTELPTVTCPANMSLSNDPGQCTATVGYCAPNGSDNCAPSTSIPGFTYLGSFGGHYYYKSSIPLNFQNAYQSAGLAGGHLATVSSAGENAFLAGYVTGFPAWIGISDGLIEGTFLGVDGCPNAYTNWAPGQPDNGGGVEDFVEMLPGGLWSDQSPLATRLALMELDGVRLNLTAGLPPYSPFPVGTTVNNIVATDASGNTATCSFTVTVNDNEAPSITCPANVVVSNDPGQCAAIVTYSVNFNDNCAGATLNQTAGLASGSSFPSGVTANTFVVTDGSGNTATCSFTVTVNDNEAPSITCPANVVVSNDPGQCAAIVTYSVNFNDNCAGATLNQTAGLASGSSFPSGVTANTFVVTDGSGNTVTCSFTVTVNDNEAPSITCPANVVVSNDPGQCAAIVTYAVSFNDNCVGATLNQAAGLASGSSFPSGVTSNAFVVTDGSGNTATCSFTVTVNDNEAPSITCPANVNVSSDPGQCAAIVTYSVSFNDNCAGATLNQTAGLASGSSFPSGVTANAFVVTDGSGNTATCSFTVTVNDTEAPSITCPANMVVSNDPGQCAAIVTYSVNFNDNCAGATLSQTAGLASGSSFAIGMTANTFVVTDGSGNTATCSFTVTVNDNEAPSITCPANVVVSNDPGQCASIVTYSVNFSDNCAGATLNQTAGLASGSSFPSGVTSNSFVVTDGSGNTATCSFIVTVNDTEAPSITCPANVVVNNDPGQCAAIATYSVSFNDNCAGATLNQTAGLASGSSFPSGVTANTYVVTDGSGNTATCSFTVTVNDTEAPSITCPANVVVNNDPGQCAAIVTYSVNFNDNCAGATLNQTAGLASGSSFPSGVTSNAFVVTDGSGNTATCSFTVTVNDTEAPSITCPANVNVSNDPGQCAAIVTYSVSFNDNCAGATLNQTTGLASGSSFPSGVTANTFVVTDGSGNTATCSFTVTVNDTEASSITCPANVVVSNDPGQCAAIVTYSVSFNDNCAGATLNQTAGLTSGSSFPSGVTSNSFVVTDGSGNTATCSFTVTVNDTEAPSITCPANVVVSNDPGQCAAIVTYSVSFNDNCTGSTLNQTAGLASGSSFPSGVTANAFVVTDGSGNTATCSFTVTVNDTEAPTINCPANVVVNNDPGQCAAIVTYSVNFNDNCAGATLNQTAGLASGSSFPSGVTSNAFFVTDGSGNTATCSFIVTVNDTEAPTITCPANVVVSNDPGQCAAIVTYSVTFNDNCAGATLNQTAGLASGSSFPSGVTSNAFVVTDGSGNTATCSFTVTVNDNEAPSITCPANVGVSNDPGLCAAIVTYSVSFNDNCTGSTLNQTAGLASGSSFPSGVTANTFVVTDGSGNTATCSFTVTVNDNEAPSITCPANVSVSTDPGQCAAIVTYSVNFSDNCAGATLNQTAGLASGISFPSGVTSNSFVVTDGSGNTATCSFTVTVNDNEAPSITCPANVVVSNDPGQCAAIVTYSVNFNDNCAGPTLNQTAGLASGSSFPSGVTSNSFVVTDGSGNTATCSFTVTVNDTEAPSITCPANVNVSNDPGQCAAIVTYSVNFNDNCTGATLNQTAGLDQRQQLPKWRDFECLRSDRRFR